MAKSAVPHPYYPRDLKLPHYVPNDKTIPEILGIFFSVLLVFTIGTWVYSGKLKHMKNSIGGRLKLIWFVNCALIHTILEGYFSFNHSTLAGEQTFLAQIWKEYGNGDSRYISSDTFTVCMETITAVIDGPLSALALYAFAANTPYRYVVQMIVSLCQLYGDVLYFSTEAMEGFSHGEMYHPLYFWFYFVFMNAIWIIIPSILIYESICAMSSSQAKYDATQGSANTSRQKAKKIR